MILPNHSSCFLVLCYFLAGSFAQSFDNKHKFHLSLYFLEQNVQIL